MRRRSWLALGAVSAEALAPGGGAMAMLQPGQRQALATAWREVFSAIGAAVLLGAPNVKLA